MITPGLDRAAFAEVSSSLSELIAIDTTNGAKPERPAAEWVAAKLAEAGLEPRIVEAAPGRASLITRVRGAHAELPPLLLHGHLDVVPAAAADWSVHPFSGHDDGSYVWGRGAVDMKNMDAILVTLARAWSRSGNAPRRDLVLAFTADEESGGEQGSRYLIEQHRELFAGCTSAISEVGGFSVSISETARLYLIQTAEKGLHWLTLRARGAPGHGSMMHPDNAVTTLASAVSRIGAHHFPVSLTPEMTALLHTLSDVVGTELDPAQPDMWLPHFGGVARMIGAALRNTVNPTSLTAGSEAHNVVPAEAEASLDVRFVPGGEQSTLARLRELAGDGIDVETMYRADAVSSPFETELVETMGRVLVQEDPAARPAPFLLSAGTDAKSFARLGMACYGFVPMQLEPGLDFAALFHGVDERISHDALHFGLRVLNRLLLTY